MTSCLACVAAAFALFSKAKAYPLICRNCPLLRTVWAVTLASWGYHLQIFLSTQHPKEIALKNPEGTVTKGTKR